jgi:hypothetical protein
MFSIYRRHTIFVSTDGKDLQLRTYQQRENLSLKNKTDTNSPKAENRPSVPTETFYELIFTLINSKSQPIFDLTAYRF